MVEVKSSLPAEIKAKEAVLVLFHSWAMLRELTPLLKAKFGDAAVLVQGESPVSVLVARHKRRVDNGEGSILVGVATLAEGLDLPGSYCTHVCIMAIPFAVPTEPVQLEMAELLGSKYFSEHALPEAMVKLTQMVGRLLRRESDIGRVTVFDRRLASTSYGRRMLACLPPFKQVIKKVA